MYLYNISACNGMIRTPAHLNLCFISSLKGYAQIIQMISSSKGISNMFGDDVDIQV